MKYKTLFLLILIANSSSAQLSTIANTDTLKPAAQTVINELPEVQHLSSEHGVVTEIEGNLGQYTGSVESFYKRYKDLFSLTNSDQLKQIRIENSEKHNYRMRQLQQYKNGLRVIGGEIRIHSTFKGDKIHLLTNDTSLDSAPTKPKLQSESALSLASLNDTLNEQYLPLKRSELAYYKTSDNPLKLVWHWTVMQQDHYGNRVPYEMLIDANSGYILLANPLQHHSLNREVWDAQNTTNGRGIRRLISEGGTSSDIAARVVYNFSADAYQTFYNLYGRDSYDDAGEKVLTTIHYGQNYPNAFASVSNDGIRLVFGDGGTSSFSGKSFSSLARDRDVVAHEFTHGVVNRTARMLARSYAGAVNEGLADIFSTINSIRVRNRVDSWSWQYGEGSYTPGKSGDALRYLNDPKLADSAVMTDHISNVLTPPPLDCGPNPCSLDMTMHRNSGIVSLPFYLMSQGGMHPRYRNFWQVNSIGWEKAGEIFYHALVNHMQSNETFQQMADHVVLSARTLYGVNSPEHFSACKAYKAVGLNANRCSLPATVDQISVTSERCRGLNRASWSAVSGATRYEVYASRSYPNFSNAFRLYSGSAREKTISVTSNHYIKVRACNNSTCGALSNDTGFASYQSGCS